MTTGRETADPPATLRSEVVTFLDFNEGWCPIQARFWLEWDATALDAPFVPCTHPRDLRFLLPTLFSAQSPQWLNARGPSRRHVRSNQRDSAEEQTYARKDRWVGRGCAK